MICEHEWDSEINGSCALCLIIQQQEQNSRLSDGLCLLDGFVEALLVKTKTDEYFTTAGKRSYRYCEGVTDTLKIIKTQISKIREQA
jgi:hypothetical protein